MAVQFKVMKNVIWELVDNRITATYTRDVPESVKIQLIFRDKDGSIKRFFEGKDPEKKSTKKRAIIKKSKSKKKRR